MPGNGASRGVHAHVPVSRAQLLGRYARVDAAGAYTRDAPSPDALFGVMMGALSGRRVGIAAVAVRQARVALAIAVRYGLLRRAFAGAPGAAETLLLYYPMHRRRLLPRLAITVVHQVVLNALKAGWSRSLGAKDCPVSSCGYRPQAVMTWHGLETMQVAREACGGQEFKRENRIGVSRYGCVWASTAPCAERTLLLDGQPRALAAQDISATFEGDNTEAVLLNRLARSIASSVAAPGVTPFDAFTVHQVATDAVARVHTQLLLLDTFTAATGAGGTAPA
eukprot:contig_25377_g6255